MVFSGARTQVPVLVPLRTLTAIEMVYTFHVPNVALLHMEESV